MDLGGTKQMATLESVSRKNFYINTRSWRLLTDLLFDKCGDLIKKEEREGWHSNYGKMISGKTASAIANRLEALMDQGVVERFKIELSIVNLQSHFSEDNLKKFIEFCRHSGGFDIW
jgi:hypothetical protein